MADSTERDPVYLQRVDELLSNLTEQLDEFDPDEVEAEAAEGVLKVTFADGSRCVINRQAPAKQVWMAAGATAWHFLFDPDSNSWVDTKGRGELRAILSDLIAQNLGRPTMLT